MRTYDVWGTRLGGAQRMVAQTQTLQNCGSQLQNCGSQSHVIPKHGYYNTTALRVINIYKLG